MSRDTAYDPTGSSYDPRFARRRWWNWRPKRLTQRQADVITALSNVIFAVALLPTVMAGAVLPIATSAATLFALLLLALVLANFRLWWGLVWNFICASMWLILLILAVL